MRTGAFVPKLFTTMHGYTRQQFAADATAGIIVGVVAVPLCIAFAIASGVTPERGLYTGIVAGFLISALGGSRVQVGGPTGAFVVPFFFGAAEAFKGALRQVHWKPRALILDREDVPVIDSTGIRALGEFIRQARREGTIVLIADLQAEPKATLAGSAAAALFGPGQLDLTFDDAVRALGQTGEPVAGSG